MFLLTDDFNFCNSLIANEPISGVDYVATFYKVINASGVDQVVSKETLDRLKGVKITSTKWVQSNFAAFVKIVESLRGEKDENHWKVVIDAAASSDARRRTLSLYTLLTPIC